MALLRGDELDLYGTKFLCELFNKSQRIVDRSFDRVKIFKAFELEGITGENGIDQAADEIVQHLRKRELIKTFENSKNVRLTDDGIDEAKKVCR